MSWVSFDDSYTEQAVWDDIPHEARWHYHALVEMACRLHMWDGRIPATRAARASDVPNPSAAVAALVSVGLLTVEPDGHVVIVEIDHHVPPEGQRPDRLLPRKRKNQSDYRRRKCERGDHDRHCPDSCPAREIDRVTDRVTEWVTGNPGTTIEQERRTTNGVTEWVTGNPGTGRDGSGREVKTAVKEEQEQRPDSERPDWECGCERPRIAVDEDGCLRCWSCGQVA